MICKISHRGITRHHTSELYNLNNLVCLHWFLLIIILCTEYVTGWINVKLLGTLKLLNTQFFWVGSKSLLIQLQLIWMSDNPDRNMKNEIFSSESSTYFKGYMGCRSKGDYSMRTFRLCWGQLERLKPRKKIFKNGFSWMKETLDFSFFFYSF
jgi:hypothetical protein